MNNMQMMSEISDTFIPSQIIENYHDLESKITQKQKWDQIPEQQIWEELCFCILSGNVSYELARSVVDVTKRTGLLDYEWMSMDKTSENKLFQEFNKPNFEPRKNNGELRKYRYPKKRSHEIKISATKIYQKSSLKGIFSNFKNVFDLRNFLTLEIPGLGIKESSHFLRNVGFTDSLAIIDVHVYRFLNEIGLVYFPTHTTLTLNNYSLIEKIMKNLSEYHGFNLAIFDLAIWYYMRNRML